MENEEFNEPPPPSADKVARRAIVLAVVACRGIVETDRANAQGASDLAKRAYDWLRALGLDEELSAGRIESLKPVSDSWMSGTGLMPVG
jgi:hypothetical protein